MELPMILSPRADEALSEFVERCREDRGWSQMGLAQEASAAAPPKPGAVSQTWVSRLERGSAGSRDKLADDDRLRRVAAALGLAPEVLLACKLPAALPTAGTEALFAKLTECFGGAVGAAPLLTYIRDVVTSARVSEHLAAVERSYPEPKDTSPLQLDPLGHGVHGLLSVPNHFVPNWIRRDIAPATAVEGLQKFLDVVWEVPGTWADRQQLGQVAASIERVLARGVGVAELLSTLGPVLCANP